jgi:hypothetical protein
MSPTKKWTVREVFDRVPQWTTAWDLLLPLEQNRFDVDWDEVEGGRRTRDPVLCVAVLPDDFCRVIIAFDVGGREERLIVPWRHLKFLPGVSDADEVRQEWLDIYEMLRFAGFDKPAPISVNDMRAEKWRSLALTAMETLAHIRTGATKAPPLRVFPNLDPSETMKEFAWMVERRIDQEAGQEQRQREADRHPEVHHDIITLERFTYLNWNDLTEVYEENSALKKQIAAHTLVPNPPEGYTMALIPLSAIAKPA